MMVPFIYNEGAVKTKNISVKNINGNKYVYLQYKKNGKRVSKYLGREDKVGIVRRMVAKIWRR